HTNATTPRTIREVPTIAPTRCPLSVHHRTHSACACRYRGSGTRGTRPRTAPRTRCPSTPRRVQDLDSFPLRSLLSLSFPPCRARGGGYTRCNRRGEHRSPGTLPAVTL